MKSPCLICIVDDDEFVRESLSSFLKSAGFQQAAFASGQELLTSTALQRADCLILDVRMPGMSGPEVLQRVIALGRRIPAIFVTGEADGKLRARIIDEYGAPVLAKPLTDEALSDAIHAALTNSHHSQANFP